MSAPVFYPALFPPVPYMAWLLGNTANWNLDSKFEKGSWRNRYRIYGPNGVQDLSAPLDHSSNKSVFKDIRLEHRNNWTEKEWRAIVTAYKNASFFEAMEEELGAIVRKEHVFLVDRVKESMAWICEQLNVNTPQESSDRPFPLTEIKPSVTDFNSVPYRQVFQLKHGFQSNLSILDLLLNEGPLAYDVLQFQNKTTPLPRQ